MWARKSSRDAEHAQDAAGYGAPSATHHRDLQDESGQVTFCRSASAAGPSHTDPNFHNTMQQVVGDLYEEQEQDDNDEQNDDEQEQADGYEQKDGDKEVDQSSSTESEETRVFHRVQDLVMEGQGGGRGTRGQG
jgi:hypothetical protein